MDHTLVLHLIESSLGDVGEAILAILGLFLTIAVGFLIFRKGWIWLSNGDEIIGSFGDIGYRNKLTGKIKWMDDPNGSL